MDAREKRRRSTHARSACSLSGRFGHGPGDWARRDPGLLFGGLAESFAPLLLGFTRGVMAVGALSGLLVPAFEEDGAGLRSQGSQSDRLSHWGQALSGHRCRLHGARGPSARASALVFLVLFIHSLPEGLAAGTALASDAPASTSL